MNGQCQSWTRATLAPWLLVVGMVLASCSGGDDAADPTSTTRATVPAATAIPSVDTDPEVTTPPTEPATTSTVPVGPLNPLTGTPQTDPAAASRPALVVKIDNHPSARPQSGLVLADIVFEENVEGITRFAAVFHSTGSDPVGPIRSGRTQDVDLLGSLNRPLFAWSGGNAGVTQAINNSDLISLSNLDQRAQSGGGFFREPSRGAPHNLYAQTSSLWTLAPPDAVAPPAQFTYRSADAPVAGAPSAGCDVEMDGVDVGWTWDPASSSYLRSQNGSAHNDAMTGAQISTVNVVILSTQYRASAVDNRSPEAITIGSGEVVVCTGGNVIVGTWSRANRLDPFVLTAADGSLIELTAGRSWVELARPGTTRAR